jgi:hypothetical protein
MIGPAYLSSHAEEDGADRTDDAEPALDFNLDMRLNRIGSIPNSEN